MFSLIKTRKIWFTISGLAFIVSLAGFLLWGLKPGIDFTGGSLLEIEFANQRPSNTEISGALEPLKLSDLTIQAIADKGVALRFGTIDEETHQKILTSLKDKFKQTMSGGEGITLELKVLDEKRFYSIGPTIGQELKIKAFWAIGLATVAIILYIAWAFRKVSRPVASWKYGTIAVLALFHDVMITVGVFVFLGEIYGLEINATFIAAILTVFGFSVHDTIVVFDRTRENLLRHVGKDFEEIVDLSIRETVVRSINTSMTAILALFSVLLLGGESIRDFTLALIVGIAVGTYSSIFIASPLLVTAEKIGKK